MYHKQNETGKKERILPTAITSDKGWADGWAKYYDLEIPHHRHRKKL